MKKFALLAFAAALVVGLVVANIFSFGRLESGLVSFNIGFGSTKGSGNIVSEKRDVAGFNAIDVSNVFVVEVTAQSEFSVEVEADDNLLPLIKTEVQNGRLEISAEKRIKSKSPIKVKIGAPNIEKLNASGASRTTISNISGNGIDIDISGASKVTLSGAANQLTADLSGASSIDATELQCEKVSVDSSGASKAKVNASGTLSVDASGASSISYVGTPATINKKTSGASSVKSL
ncbi:MAG TPA: head GIN domain-containing protein [Pyrinomonadaceae bacterium]|nr:head GIN domain-containing protein [Pyrinomonadaceae bacterium]